MNIIEPLPLLSVWPLYTLVFPTYLLLAFNPCLICVLVGIPVLFAISFTFLGTNGFSETVKESYPAPISYIDIAKIFA